MLRVRGKVLPALTAGLLAMGLLASGCGGTNSKTSGASSSTAGASSVASTPSPRVTALPKEPGAVKFENAVPGSGKGLKLGYISLSEAVPFVHLATLSIEQQARRAGAQLVFCDSQNDAAKALSCAKTLSVEHVQGYLNFQPIVQASPSICAAAPPVPVIAIDVHQPPCEKAFMGANDSFAGYLAGRAVGAYFKQKFNCKYDAYVSLQGFEVGAVNTERMGGYDRGFSSVCGPVKNERKVQADKIDQARTAFTDVLTALPSQSHIIVVAINDDGIEGALAAAKTAGRVNDLYVSGQGADPSAWCEIKNNKQWIADTAYFPEQYGKIGIPYLVKLIKHQPVPKLLYVPHAIINSQNISDYYKVTGC